MAITIPPQLCDSNSTREALLFRCMRCTSGGASIVSFALADALLLLALLCGLLLGRRRRAAPSHSDVITYHLVAMETGLVVGMFCFCGFIYRGDRTAALVGYCCTALCVTGQTVLQCLSCLDHYLAVIHPVAYRGLRRPGGVRLRNAAIAGAWLVGVATTGLVAWMAPHFPTNVFVLVFSTLLGAVTYCSVSVLRFLVGALPGRNRKPYARAFRVILATSAAILLRFCGLLAFNMVVNRPRLSAGACMLVLGGMWTCLPSSLVLPLLSIKRSGTPGCSACHT